MVARRGGPANITRVTIGRREFLLATLTAAVGCRSVAPRASGTTPPTHATGAMYGLIGKMTATPGDRDALIAVLLESTGDMPGCLSYVVAKDAADANAIWITEVWDSKESHDASLSLPAVRAAIARARPLIAGFAPGTTTEPVGGVGLPTGGGRR